MLVDASQFPGPAMFQGIGFIAIGVYAVIVYLREKREAEARKERARLRNEAILKAKAEIAKRKEERDNWPLEKKLEHAKVLSKLNQRYNEEKDKS